MKIPETNERVFLGEQLQLTDFREVAAGLPALAPCKFPIQAVFGLFIL